ncbi:MAG: sugar kinase [Candidatus Limnocylindrales bacterium]|jgi:2-dehydro-3-deoxygluconokinase
MRDLVTFGEAMLRLAAPGQRRLEQTASLEVTVGGAELNVAAGVSRLGLSTEWVSCLPDNALGRKVRNKAREFGVDLSHVAWDKAGRMGLFFVEYGASPRASSVLYDRADSAFSELRGASFDWPAILADARAFHTTGITPALGERTTAETVASLATARKLGLVTAYDLNFRGRLWSPDRARAVQEPLMQYVDVLVTTEEDAETVFGITGTDYREVARKLADRYGFKVVTITIRGDLSVLRNTWTAIAYSDGVFVDDRTYELELVDRIGGGDAYAAGFLYGLLTGNVEKGVRYGNAFSALKQASWEDFNYATLAEVEAQLRGAGSRIVR